MGNKHIVKTCPFLQKIVVGPGLVITTCVNDRKDLAECENCIMNEKVYIENYKEVKKRDSYRKTRRKRH